MTLDLNVQQEYMKLKNEILILIICVRMYRMKSYN